jgi:N-methylhydantoinase A/oxoprolinase/acetone carboxylase beta subunit
MRAMFLGIDTGGTYTDAVLLDPAHGVIAKAKALTTHHDLEIGIAGAVRAALLQGAVPGSAITLVSLSTTLATNALVEGRRRPVGLIMIGFGEDDLSRAGLAAALGRDPVLFTPGGHDHAGREIAPLDEAAIEAFAHRHTPHVQGFALAALFSTRNRSHEEQALAAIRRASPLPVSASHALAQQLDGPRRALTALFNARLIGLISDLIRSTQAFLAECAIVAPLMVVRGDGALIAADVARERPIETILSGPAATLVGAGYLSGLSDALVSDIGGTTTDIAVMKGGSPRIDPAGALVGGFRTMVEAVPMTTIGLGGDSEARLERKGLSLALELGPRRAAPVCLIALEHEGIVLPALERQSERDAPSELDGCFALRMPMRAEAMSNLTGIEAAVFAAMDGPVVPLDRLCRKRAELGALHRLAAAGYVLISRVTPSDAAHALGRYSAWHGDAARLALALFARQRDPRGRPAYESGEAAARAMIDRLIRLSGEALIDVAAIEDGHQGPPLSRHGMIQKWLDRKEGLSRLSFDIGLPVIAVGASASAYYPTVGELVEAKIILPPHADVANAVGAVVGHVRIIRSATVTEPGEGRFRVNGIGELPIFSSAEEAIAAGSDTLRAIALADALAAGAAEPDVTVMRADRIAEADGLTVFIESVLTATAIGRPRLGRPG